MNTLKQIYMRNDVLLVFLWKEQNSICQEVCWQSQCVAKKLLSYNEDELHDLLVQNNLLQSTLTNPTDLRVYRVGSMQELFPNVEFV